MSNKGSNSLSVYSRIREMESLYGNIIKLPMSVDVSKVVHQTNQKKSNILSIVKK